MKRYILIILFFISILTPAQMKISDLSSATTLSEDDLFLIVNGTVKKKITWSAIKNTLHAIKTTVSCSNPSWLKSLSGNKLVDSSVTIGKLKETILFGVNGKINESANVNTTSLQSAINSISQGVLTIASIGKIPINSFTVPDSIVLRFMPGTILSPQSGQTLTVNGKIDAGLYQIFDTTGTVDLSGAKLTEVYPQWFGASSSASSGLNRKAIELSILRAPNKAVVKFSDSCDVDDFISINRSNIILDGTGATIRQVGTSCNSIFQTSYDVTVAGNLENITIKNFRLIGSGFGTHNFGNHGCGIYVGNNSSNILIENNYIQDMVHAGIYAGDNYLTPILGDNIRIIGNRIVSCGKDGVNGPGIQVMGNHIWVLDNYVTGSAFNGIDCNSVHPIIQGNYCAYNGRETGSFDTLSRCGIIIANDTILDGDISHNQCFYNGNSVHNGDGIFVQANVGYNVNISNNIIKYNTRNGIFAESAYPNGGQFNITGNSLSSNGTAGKNWNQIDIRAPYSIISNNTLEHQINKGIYVARSNCVLNGNTIKGTEYVSEYGIWLNALAFGSIVSNNHISNFGDRGIMIESGADGSTITNNVIRGIYADIIHDEASGTNRSGNSMMYGDVADPLSGAVNLVGGTVTVTNHEVQTGDHFVFQHIGKTGTPGILYLGGITDKTSFTILSTSATDSSLVFYQIIH